MKEKCPLCSHKLIRGNGYKECSYWRCNYKEYYSEEEGGKND